MDYSIEFEDLFDWEVESDRHYWAMVCHNENIEERENFVSPIIIKDETNISTRKVRKSVREKLLIRSHLLAKAVRTKSRYWKP